jgi:hypothetical protein
MNIPTPLPSFGNKVRTIEQDVKLYLATGKGSFKAFWNQYGNGDSDTKARAKAAWRLYSPTVYTIQNQLTVDTVNSCIRHGMPHEYNSV